MEYSDVTKLETRLVAGLKEEYSFYQSLFIIIDKQRDYIKYDKEQKIVDLYGEVERIVVRINESETAINQLKNENKNLFSLAASAPEVRRLVNSITTLISKTLKLVQENEEIASAKYDKIKEQLLQLQQGRKVTDYLTVPQNSALYVDKKN
ncbi:MAG: hypothetical protein WBP42_05995 [Candidatus Zixiibacteriota bacterium]